MLVPGHLSRSLKEENSDNVLFPDVLFLLYLPKETKDLYRENYKTLVK